jgi:hypothetical protein
VSDSDVGPSGVPGETPIYDELRIVLEAAGDSGPIPVELHVSPLAEFGRDPLGAPMPGEVPVDLPAPSRPPDDELPSGRTLRPDAPTEVPSTPWIPTQSRNRRGTHAREDPTSPEEPAPAPIVLPRPTSPTHDLLDFPVNVLRGSAMSVVWPWDADPATVTDGKKFTSKQV